MFGLRAMRSSSAYDYSNVDLLMNTTATAATPTLSPNLLSSDMHVIVYFNQDCSCLWQEVVFSLSCIEILAFISTGELFG